MARWVCKCGQNMDDHNCPDKNCFRVFSDELWDEISNMADENNKINWFDIPQGNYEMYKCPSCGRLMIFGEDENIDRFIFYRKEN